MRTVRTTMLLKERLRHVWREVLVEETIHGQGRPQAGYDASLILLATQTCSAP